MLVLILLIIVQGIVKRVLVGWVLSLKVIQLAVKSVQIIVKPASRMLCNVTSAQTVFL